MVWEVVLHDEVRTWFFGLDETSKGKFTVAIRELERSGPTLGRPVVDHVKGSKVRNLKELRLRGSTMRCLFAFDPERRAILLVAGDKQSQWEKWYQKSIPVAEERFFEILNQKAGGVDE